MSRLKHTVEMKLYRDSFAFGSLAEAKVVLQILSASQDTIDGLHKNALFVSFVASYCRPFLPSNNQVGQASDKFVPTDLKALHSSTLEMRHKVVAHLDPTGRDDNGKQYNELDVIMENHSFYPVLMKPTFSLDLLPSYFRLVEEQLFGFSEVMKAHYTALPKEVGDLEDGRYNLNYELEGVVKLMKRN